MRTGVLSRGVRWLRREVDHTSPFNAEVKKEWSYTSTHPICLQGTERGSFSLSLPCSRDKIHVTSLIQVYKKYIIIIIIIIIMNLSGRLYPTYARAYGLLQHHTLFIFPTRCVYVFR